MEYFDIKMFKLRVKCMSNKTYAKLGPIAVLTKRRAIPHWLKL